MAASEELREQLYRRGGGRCECRMKTCTHHAGMRCKNGLRDKWEVHRTSTGAALSMSNSIALCPKCHQNTLKAPPSGG